MVIHIRFGENENFELAHILRRNFNCDKSERMLALCYDRRARDGDEANNDFDAFWLAFSKEYPACDYIKQNYRCPLPLFRQIIVLVKRRDGKQLMISDKWLRHHWRHGTAWSAQPYLPEIHDPYFPDTHLKRFSEYPGDWGCIPFRSDDLWFFECTDGVVITDEEEETCRLCSATRKIRTKLSKER